MAADTSLPELTGMQPLLAYHSRLPLGFDLQQALCYKRTLEPSFLLLIQAGCVYIRSQFLSLLLRSRGWNGEDPLLLPNQSCLPLWSQLTPVKSECPRYYK